MGTKYNFNFQFPSTTFPPHLHSTSPPTPPKSGNPLAQFARITKNHKLNLTPVLEQEYLPDGLPIGTKPELQFH